MTLNQSEPTFPTGAAVVSYGSAFIVSGRNVYCGSQILWTLWLGLHRKKGIFLYIGAGMYKVSYQVCWERLPSIEDEKENSWLWGNIKREKKGKGKQNHPPYIIFSLLGRISSGKEGWNFREENQDRKNEAGEGYQVVGNLFQCHPGYWDKIQITF